VTREDSVLWRVANAAGDVLVRYRVRYPDEGSPRASWRPFLAPTGGLVGGPHSFLYLVGQERAPVSVTLDLPRGWKVGTGLAGSSDRRSFTAAGAHALMESPMLVGVMSEWAFRAGGVPHRVFYWPLPGGQPFDTAAFVGGIERMSSEAVRLFGGTPYREYTFLFQDGAYGGGLEHPNSVTLGAESRDLARDPYAVLREAAHEFVHTWNLMAIRPAGYRGVDYRTQPPVDELWFSEGLTLFYADLLIRRAGLPSHDTTRTAHLEGLIGRYLANPGNAHFSAEQVSRVAYNAGPGALGDYTASSHLQGELIGAMLDLLIRDATSGTRSMDDVMRLMYARFTTRGFTGTDVERAVEEVCGCNADAIFAGSVRQAGPVPFERYLAPLGLRLSVSWRPGVDDSGAPQRDLRIWGWTEGSEPGLRLRVTDPASIWGRAGLHTGDRLESANGKPLRTWPELRGFLLGLAIGDSARIAVRRPAGVFEARVKMQQLQQPVVRIEPVEGPARQRMLREAWLAGR
jgi:predicted metalloprotease with PDZ domain